MDKSPKSKVKEISSPIRAKGGQIIGFKLSNNSTLSRQQALVEARRGNLIGVNLYPDFVNEVTKKRSKKGLIYKIFRIFKGKN